MNPTDRARAVLQEQRVRLEALVGTVVPLAHGQRWVLVADGESPCGTPTDSGWPRRWSYGLRIVRGTEPGLAQRVVGRYRADGWAFTAALRGGPVTRLKAVRDGVLLVVTHGEDGASVDVSADGPCVHEDGTIRG